MLLRNGPAAVASVFAALWEPSTAPPLAREFKTLVVLVWSCTWQLGRNTTRASTNAHDHVRGSMALAEGSQVLC